MDRTEEAVAAAVAFLRERVTRAPAAVLVLGSGMGAVADSVTDPVRIGYDEIPGFPRSTVAGHRGSLEVGRLGDVEVAILRGRFHAYEGWSQQALTLPLRVLAAFGARSLVVTNAAGGIARWLTPGDLMLIHDHINFQFRNPLIGGVVPGDDRFPDMSDPYDPDLRALADATAAELGIALKGCTRPFSARATRRRRRSRCISDSGRMSSGCPPSPKSLSRELSGWPWSVSPS